MLPVVPDLVELIQCVLDTIQTNVVMADAIVKFYVTYIHTHTTYRIRFIGLSSFAPKSECGWVEEG